MRVSLTQYWHDSRPPFDQQIFNSHRWIELPSPLPRRFLEVVEVSWRASANYGISNSFPTGACGFSAGCWHRCIDLMSIDSVGFRGQDYGSSGVGGIAPFSAFFKCELTVHTETRSVALRRIPRNQARDHTVSNLNGVHWMWLSRSIWRRMIRNCRPHFSVVRW